MENTQTKEVATATKQEEKKVMTARFSAMVEKESNDNAGVVLSDKQKSILQGYVDSINKSIDNYNEIYKDKKTPLSWNNIDLKSLSRQAYINSLLGLDSMQDGMIYFIPYQIGNTGRFTMNMMRGYNGIRYIAEKYSKDKIVSITFELIYSNDEFIMNKKDVNNEYDTYNFKITNPFNRGNLVGGFGYIEYEDKRKNKLVVITKEELDKRRKLAKSTKFWGDEKSGTGWSPEMYLKSLMRNVCHSRNIQLDPDKMGREVYIEAENIEERAKQALNNLDDEQEPVKIIDADITPPVNVPVETEESEPVEIPVETEQPQPKRAGREDL